MMNFAFKMMNFAFKMMRIFESRRSQLHRLRTESDLRSTRCRRVNIMNLISKNDEFCISNDAFLLNNDDFDALQVKNDDFPIKNDGFTIKNDDFPIKNDGFTIKMMICLVLNDDLLLQEKIAGLVRGFHDLQYKIHPFLMQISSSVIQSSALLNAKFSTFECKVS